MLKKKILNEGNQIHNFILCVCENFCDTVPFYYGSDSDLLTSYGSGSTQQKVRVPTVPVPQHCLVGTGGEAGGGHRAALAAHHRLRHLCNRGF
jgi:hypothetical protein